MVTEGGTIKGSTPNSTVIERFTLDNGVRVITEEIPWVESVSLGCFVLVGAAYEPKRLSGISHFMEHMVFKGSKGRSARDIVMEIESLGGVINAATGKEFTNFYTKIYHKHLRKAVDILIDIAFNPLFKEADINREKGVVLEELRMGEDNPDEFIIDRFNRNVFGDTPFGRKIPGNMQSVSSFNRKDLSDFHQLHYRPSNLVISAAGKINGEGLKALLEECFANASLMDFAPLPKTKLRLKPNFRPARFQEFKDVEQTTLVIGFPSVSVKDPNRYAFALIDAHLAGGMSSRLFQEVREKRGLVYSIDSTQAPFSRYGLYTIEAGMVSRNAAPVAKVVARELNRVVDKGVSSRALKNAREYMKGVMLLALENSTARMGRNAMNEIYFRRSIPLSELIESLDRITPEETQALASRIFDPAKLAVGILTSNELKGEGDSLLKAVCREFRIK
jgi:predicted Zn-dependent peptidase